jgi:hypothetical protein
MKTIVNQITETLVLSNDTIGGVNGYISLTAKSNNQIPAGDEIDLMQCTLRVALKRAGKTYQICNDKLKYLMTWNSFADDTRWKLSQGVVGTKFIQSAEGASKKGSIIVPFEVLFGQAINLRGTDELVLECETLNLVDDTVTGSITFKGKKVIGVGREIPTIRRATVPTQVNDWEFPIPANSNHVMFYNENLADDTKDTAVIEQLTVANSLYTTPKKYNHELLRLERSEGSEHMDDTLRKQTFVIHTGIALPKTKLQFQFDASKVAVAKNHILYYQGIKG